MAHTSAPVDPAGVHARDVGFVSAAWAFTGRSVRHFVRSPESVVSTVGFPLLLMLTLLAVFASAIEAFAPGPHYIQRLVPGLIVMGIMFGTTSTAAQVYGDLHGGFYDRLRSLPAPVPAFLVGTVVAEVARAAAAVVVITGLGVALGFRFEHGWWALPAYFVVGAAAALSFTWVGIWLATIATSYEGFAPLLSAVFTVLLFLSKSFAPLEAYPNWAQPLVEWNPATAYVEVLYRLANGGELAGPLLLAGCWSVAFVAIFGGLAARHVRRHRTRA